MLEYREQSEDFYSKTVLGGGEFNIGFFFFPPGFPLTASGREKCCYS